MINNGLTDETWSYT